MSLSYLLDTSVLCQSIKDHPASPAMERWSRAGDAAIGTSAICVAEILQGLEARRSDKYWRRYRMLLDGRYPVLPFDAGCATVFGNLAGQLHRAGNPRPVVDLMIAATALRHGLTVATLNSRDFVGLPEVRVEDWSA